MRTSPSLPPRRTSAALAIGSLAVLVAGAAGCATSNGEDVASGEDALARAVFTSGLWALDGAPEDGDLSLLAFDGGRFAGVVHGSFVQTTSKEGLELARPEVVQADTTTGGALDRAPRGGPAFSVGSDDATSRYVVALDGERLRLTGDDGAVRHYKRNYRLYCTSANTGREATMILEVGAAPRLLGVNGDGVRFPAAGTYAATVKTDELFADETYAVESETPTGTVIVRFPWTTMAQPLVRGAIVVVPSGVAEETREPVAIACERVFRI